MTTGANSRRYPFIRSDTDIRKGLTSAEVQARRDAGAANREPGESSHSYAKIISDNVFTLFNCINLIIAAAVVFVGHPRNAIFFGVAACNTIMGIAQEARAKRALDRLTVLTQPYARVIRDGAEVRIPRSDAVLDDVILFYAGDQICVDAYLVESEGLEVDESALTGESENVHKRHGDTLLSGSFAVAGRGTARATAVGAESWAHALAAEAKRRKKNETPMMKAINRIIKVLSIAIAPIGALLFVKNLGSGAAEATLGAAAAAIGMIPEGLVLLTGVTMTLGAIRLAAKKTLVQSLPSVETLARTDVLCLDKTGTITDGTLALISVEPLDDAVTREQAERILFETVKATGDDNATARAILAGLRKTDSDGAGVGSPVESGSAAGAAPIETGSDAMLARVETGSERVGSRVAFTPFSSARKWSAATFAPRSGGSAETTYILGAPGFVAGESLANDGSLRAAVESRAKDGLRAMILARSEERVSLSEDGAAIARDPKPVALVTLADAIRPDAKGAFDYFASEGVDIKVISGDDPQTVSAIARRVGIAGADRYVDMSKIDIGGESANIAELALSHVVFGRASPSQKRELIAALKSANKTVCMTGDGVNDVPAMKEADCGIALGEGADAARGAADIALLGSGFSAMLETLYEGRRVINNIERVAALYLIKTIWSAALAAIFLALPFSYPFAPLQLTPINMFAVGIPTFFLALRKDTRKPLGRFYSNVFLHSIPSAAVIVANVALVYAAGAALGLDEPTMAAMRVILTGACAFFALFRVARPTGAPGRAAFAALACLFAAALGLSWNFIGLGGVAPEGAVALVPLAASIPVQFAAYAALARKIRALAARLRAAA